MTSLNQWQILDMEADGRRNVLVYNDELLGDNDADGGHVSGPAVLLAVLSPLPSQSSPHRPPLFIFNRSLFSPLPPPGLHSILPTYNWTVSILCLHTQTLSVFALASRWNTSLLPSSNSKQGVCRLRRQFPSCHPHI